MKFKMAATAGLSLTLDPMGEMFQNASSLKPHGISTPYLWYFDPPTHGILTPLPMVYRPPYPWYFDPPIHGISTPIPMVYGISTPLSMEY